MRDDKQPSTELLAGRLSDLGDLSHCNFTYQTHALVLTTCRVTCVGCGSGSVLCNIDIILLNTPYISQCRLAQIYQVDLTNKFEPGYRIIRSRSSSSIYSTMAPIRVGIVGLSSKPGTWGMLAHLPRESISLPLSSQRQRQCCNIHAPQAPPSVSPTQIQSYIQQPSSSLFI